MSFEKLALLLISLLIFTAALTITTAVLWANLDEQHQQTTRICLQHAKLSGECERFSEVP